MPYSNSCLRWPSGGGGTGERPREGERGGSGGGGVGEKLWRGGEESDDQLGVLLGLASVIEGEDDGSLIGGERAHKERVDFAKTTPTAR